MRLVSLFSGCGGLDLGFERAGYERLWANDFDQDAQEIFRLNLGEIDGRNIKDIKINEIPDCDILTAGFPCQPFSNAGKRGGVDDERGNLFRECLRIIEDKMPSVVLFENVKGILSINDENGNKLIDTIKNELDNIGSLGYNFSYKLLNASDYGVPQKRERVIMIAIRKDLNVDFQFPKPLIRTNLELKHVLNIPENISNQIDWKLSPQAQMLIQYIPEGGSWKSIPYEVLPERFRKIRDNIKKYRSPNFYRRFARTEINGTITAAAQPENCGIIHPIHNRRYTIREVARIQSFPDNFLFVDNSVKKITAMYKVIGNAVPPKLAEVIAKSIKEQIFDKV